MTAGLNIVTRCTHENLIYLPKRRYLYRHKKKTFKAHWIPSFYRIDSNILQRPLIVVIVHLRARVKSCDSISIKFFGMRIPGACVRNQAVHPFFFFLQTHTR